MNEYLIDKRLDQPTATREEYEAARRDRPCWINPDYVGLPPQASVRQFLEIEERRLRASLRIGLWHRNIVRGHWLDHDHALDVYATDPFNSSRRASVFGATLEDDYSADSFPDRAMAHGESVEF